MIKIENLLVVAESTIYAYIFITDIFKEYFV